MIKRGHPKCVLAFPNNDDLNSRIYEGPFVTLHTAGYPSCPPHHSPCVVTAQKRLFQKSEDELTVGRRPKEHHSLLHSNHKKFDKGIVGNTKLFHSYTSPHIGLDHRFTSSSLLNTSSSTLSLTKASNESKQPIPINSGRSSKSPLSYKFKGLTILSSSKSHQGAFNTKSKPESTSVQGHWQKDDSLKNNIYSNDSYTLSTEISKKAKSSAPKSTILNSFVMTKPELKLKSVESDPIKIATTRAITSVVTTAPKNLSNQIFNQITKVEQDADAQSMIETVEKTGEMTIRVITNPLTSTSSSKDNPSFPKQVAKRKDSDVIEVTSSGSINSKSKNNNPKGFLNIKGTCENSVSRKSSLASTLFRRRDSSVSSREDGNSKTKMDNKISNEPTTLDNSTKACEDSKLIIQMIEIIKRPGQTLGLYIREGNGSERSDGVFISRMAIGSSIERSGLLKVGDEILKVNGVDVTQMGLDDVVVIMSIPRRLLLEIKTSDKCKENYSITLSDAALSPGTQPHPVYTPAATNATTSSDPNFLPRARLDDRLNNNQIFSPNVGSALYLYDNNDVKISDQNIRQQYRNPVSLKNPLANLNRSLDQDAMSPPQATLTTAQVASAHFPSTSPTHKATKHHRLPQCDEQEPSSLRHVEDNDYLYYNSQPFVKQAGLRYPNPKAYEDMITSKTYPHQENIMREATYPKQFEKGKITKLKDRDDNRPYMYLVTEKMDDCNRKHLGDGISYYYSYYPTCRTDSGHHMSKHIITDEFSRQPEGYYYYYHQPLPSEAPQLQRAMHRDAIETTYFDNDNRKTYSLDRPKRYTPKHLRRGAEAIQINREQDPQFNALNYNQFDDIAQRSRQQQQDLKDRFKANPLKAVSIDDPSSAHSNLHDYHLIPANGDPKQEMRSTSSQDEENWLYKDQSQRLAQYGTVYRPLGSYANRRRAYADTCTQTDPFSSVTKYHNGYFSDGYSEERQDETHRALLLGAKALSPEFTVASDTEATSMGRRSRLNRNHEGKASNHRYAAGSTILNQNDIQQIYRSPREEMIYIHSPRTDLDGSYMTSDMLDDSNNFYENINNVRGERQPRYSPNLYNYQPSNSFHSSLDSRYRSPHISAKSASRRYVLKKNNAAGYNRLKTTVSGASSDILPFVKRDRAVASDVLWYESEHEPNHRVPSRNYTHQHDYWMRRFDDLSSQNMPATDSSNMAKYLLKRNLVDRNQIAKHSIPEQYEDGTSDDTAYKEAQTIEERKKELKSSLKSTSTTTTNSTTRRVHYIDNGRLMYKPNFCDIGQLSLPHNKYNLVPMSQTLLSQSTAATTTLYPKFSMEPALPEPSDTSDLSQIKSSDSMTFSFNELDLSDYELVSPTHFSPISKVASTETNDLPSSYVWPRVTGLLNVYVCACKDLGVPQHVSNTHGLRERTWFKSSSISGVNGKSKTSFSDSEAGTNYSEASPFIKIQHYDDNRLPDASTATNLAKVVPNFPRKSSLYVIIEVDKCIKARTCAKPLAFTRSINHQSDIYASQQTMPIIWDEAFEIDLLGAKEIDLFFYHWKEVIEEGDQKANTNGVDKNSASYFTVPKLCYQVFLHLPSLLRNGTKTSDRDIFNGNDCHSKTRKLKISLQPRGTLYLKLEFLNPTIVFLRTPKIPRGLFGVDLGNLPHTIETGDHDNNHVDTAIGNEKNMVLDLFLTLIPEIERRGGLNSVALYNLCSCLREKRMVKVSMEKDMKATNLMEKGVPDLNILTDIVKDFLRELPEPLITNSLYQMLVEAYSVCNPSDPQGNETLLWSVIECLPKLNRVNLNYLVKHLKRVLAHSRFNKMDIDQLCAIFGPIVLTPSTNSPEASHPDLEKSYSIFKYLIQIWKYDDSILAKI